MDIIKLRYHCNLLNFQGRGFNVQVHFVEEPISDYVQAAVSTVLSIHDRVLIISLRDLSLSLSLSIYIY